MRGIQHFGYYLVGRRFTVETDHRAVQFLQSARHVNGRLSRWALMLQPYDFKIRYRPGHSNANADGLSRQAWEVVQASGHDNGLRPSEGGGDVGTSWPNKTTKTK